MKNERDPILEEHLAALRAEEDARPPEDLLNRAWMRALQERRRDETATGPRAWVRRLWKPREIRLRLTPAVGLAMASMLLASAWVASEVSRQPRAPLADERPSVAPASASGAEPGVEERTAAPAGAALDPGRQVPVRFVLPAEGADRVAVAGDFNDWQVDEIVLDDPEGDGVFVGTVWLNPGTYSYMFVVDGERWVTDPYASNHRNDGFGQKNAVLRID